MDHSQKLKPFIKIILRELFSYQISKLYKTIFVHRNNGDIKGLSSSKIIKQANLGLNDDQKEHVLFQVLQLM